ncbi:hypothetical protein, partial [uncultured Bilophila sp.]|uniref:hypothetical protein n=1 Tax=uncultured Bilophila sp. TaxID=529385 RepID=UPI00262254A4
AALDCVYDMPCNASDRCAPGMALDLSGIPPRARTLFVGHFHTERDEAGLFGFEEGEGLFRAGTGGL